MNKIIKKGFIDDNPVLIQALGMCPTLAVTATATDGLGMGLSTTAVLLGSNFFISLFKNYIPSKVRIPSFIIVIATFVTLIQFLLAAFLPALNESLGLFIPLIVVNCLILGRAEAFASKNSPFNAILDAIGMGLGFTFALTLIGLIREVLGAGAAFGFMVLPEALPRTLFMILPPGAFVTLGFIMAYINARRDK